MIIMMSCGHCYRERHDLTSSAGNHNHCSYPFRGIDFPSDTRPFVWHLSYTYTDPDLEYTPQVDPDLTL